MKLYVIFGQRTNRYEQAAKARLLVDLDKLNAYPAAQEICRRLMRD